MTTPQPLSCSPPCPAEDLLHLLAGRLALRELCEAGLLTKTVIKAKPLHIEYKLSEKGEALVPVFRALEQVRL